MPDLVEYRVGLGARTSHHFEVEARFPTSPAEANVELRLPVWTPGSYLIREYQRHLEGLRCTDEQGRELPTRKIDKACWRVEAQGARAVVARYRVYAHEVTVRTCHLDDSHAYWNGAPMFLYVDELRGLPARVRVDGLPAGWRVTTGLEREEPIGDAGADADGGEPVFRAADYDTLIDSPVEAGPHERLEFSAAGRAHAVAVWGRAEFDRQRFVDDLRALVEAQAALFGGLPFERYAFLMHLVPGGYGGLEHRNSSTVLSSPHAFASERKYQELLELCSHEFFHLWNGKRIRPAALGPFDYQRECHTRSLWVVEGWTSYYDRLFLRRAGHLPAARWRERLAEDIQRLLRIPGRFQQSIEESSFDAWIKLYRPDESNVNTTVSYYLKGSLAALLLDLEIRARTGGQRSLDDALRLLWREYERTGRGYSDESVQPLVEEAAGVRLDDFFARAVRGRDELDLDGPLATVGLELRRTVDGDEGAAWLGANLRQEARGLRVTESLAGSPAELGGLSPGDEILAWGGYRVDEEGVRERLAAARPGTQVRLTIFRRDELREVAVTLGSRPHDRVEVVQVAQPSDAQRAAYEAWMGEAWGG